MRLRAVRSKIQQRCQTSITFKEHAMEFHVDGLPVTADMAAIADAIYSIDPAALVDIDPATGALRVSAALNANDLTAAIGTTGQEVGGILVMQLPSHCCGGCGG
jgi:hypothetical protein